MMLFWVWNGFRKAYRMDLEQIGVVLGQILGRF